jgi:hypothetical protein
LLLFSGLQRGFSQSRKGYIIAPAWKDIAPKDIASAAIIGASAISAVLLVFVGFMIAKAEALPAETDNKIIKRYRNTARWGFFPLLILVLVTLAAYLWMFYPSCSILYWTWSCGFVVGMLCFLAYCVITMWMM